METAVCYNYGLIKEIQTILTYTNATPYKSKSGRYYCAYCSTEGPNFEDADDLRLHCKTEHAAERIRGIEIIMRPAWKNEVLKMDIANLHCTFCFTEIDHWNGMFSHLKTKHDVDLDEAYSKVIPYCLTSDLLCCLCNAKFPTYHMLDSHMNAHYNNYVCGQCGETYISESRLKKHSETHMSARFKCQYCDKVFTLDRYRRKHINYVHKKNMKFKCVYCPEVFNGEYPRHFHCLEVHKEKVKTISCEMCNRTFNWRPYYLKHMRLAHRERKKKHKCSECPKYFSMKHQLHKHEQWHKGEHKRECAICLRQFSSAQYLRKHYAKHLATLNEA